MYSASFRRCKVLLNSNISKSLCRLMGTLPPEGLSSLVSLQLLDLSDNQLTGTLPTEGIPSMTGLQVLDLSSNQFTGFLPSSWGSLSRSASM